MNVKWPITLTVKEKLNEVVMKILHHFLPLVQQLQQIATLIILFLDYWIHSVQGYWITSLRHYIISLLKIGTTGFPLLFKLIVIEVVDLRENKGKIGRCSKRKERP